MPLFAGQSLTETVWRDHEFMLSRSLDADGKPVLVRTPASDHPQPAILRQLTTEYELRSELDPDWAAQPLALISEHGKVLLVLDDNGSDLLEQHCSQPMELEHFLKLAIEITTVLGKMHGHGLIHKNIRPASILIDPKSGAVRLTGFGITSRLPRERQAPEPLEVIAGTFAYMAPEQTGRMNRSIDTRSDLYAFGVTCYRMLAGALPFSAADPMEWVHCHVARPPTPLSEWLPGLPDAVSTIVMKLLAKNAEDRYRSAAGVAADFTRCLTELRISGYISPFPPGLKDFSTSLIIPEKLYGREREIRTLFTAFDGVSREGTSDLVLISGYSGIGKSALTNELQKAIVEKGALFLCGKCDQYKRDIPYSVFAQSLRALVQLILGLSDTAVTHWRSII